MTDLDLDGSACAEENASKEPKSSLNTVAGAVATPKSAMLAAGAEVGVAMGAPPKSGGMGLSSLRDWIEMKAAASYQEQIECGGIGNGARKKGSFERVYGLKFTF